MSKHVEPLSDHPLFRVLVLMGGGLAMGCGGVAQGEAPLDIASAGAANGGAPSSGLGGSVASVGGALSIGTSGASTQAAAGAGGSNVAAIYDPSCPYEQWNCGPGTSNSACYFYLTSKDDPLAAGCFCDTSRPTSAAACKADENFVCRQAYPPYVEAQPQPSTWDGTLHVQCACVLAPAPSSDDCNATCASAFGAQKQCFLPSAYRCDGYGVCTATSADVLRQDGIMCGCADIGLK